MFSGFPPSTKTNTRTFNSIRIDSGSERKPGKAEVASSIDLGFALFRTSFKITCKYTTHLSATGKFDNSLQGAKS